MKKQISVFLLILWLGLAAFSWFSPPKASSDSERRPLAQRPELTVQSLLSGKFMADFEDYTLDQFPLRETFRTVKSLFHTEILGQKDNNGIYIAQGHALKQEYPLREESLEHALERLEYLYENYLTDCRIFMAIVPDKGYYLAEESGHLAMDYDGLYRFFREGMPWATHIDLRDSLDADSFYRTDTHWKQEKILPAAVKVGETMGRFVPETGDFRMTLLEKPFYGVYYGQAALPMEPDRITILESDWLAGCTVYDHESGKTLPVYDLTKLEGKDPYEVYLSGPRSLLTIENPNAGTDRELLVFRDSFGSALIPLLMHDYAKVTVVDIRYIQSELLDRFVEFGEQDVLILYSTLVLNNSETIK